MGCFGVSKCLLIFFNVVLFLVGSTLTAAGIYLKVAGLPEGLDAVAELLNKLHLDTSAYILIGVGATMFVISLIGCVGATRESTCLISTYLVFLLVLLLAQAAMVGYLFINRSSFENDEAFVVDFLKKNFVNRETGKNFERDFKCCGLDRINLCNKPSDNTTTGLVTEGCRCEGLDTNSTTSTNTTSSCVKLSDVSDQCSVGGGFTGDDLIYSQSCPEKLLNIIEEVKSNKFVLGLGIGAAALQLLGLVFSIVICHRIRTTGEAFDDDHI